MGGENLDHLGDGKSPIDIGLHQPTAAGHGAIPGDKQKIMRRKQVSQAIEPVKLADHEGDDLAVSLDDIGAGSTSLIAAVTLDALSEHLARVIRVDRVDLGIAGHGLLLDQYVDHGRHINKTGRAKHYCTSLPNPPRPP